MIIYLIKCDFILVFNNCENSHITSKLIDNKTTISWRNLFDKVIIDFSNKGYDFDHITELNILTIANKMNILYDFYIKHNTHAVERKLNMISARNPNLINSLNRFHNHPLTRKCSHLPFNNY